MKIRTGFVSNSSSSSFILCVPKGTTEEQIKKKIEKHVEELNGSCLSKGLTEEIIDTFMEVIIEHKNYKGCKTTLQDFLEELKECLEDGLVKQELVDFWQDKLGKNWDFYYTGFSDNGEGHIQYSLCYTPFKVKEKDFFMENTARG